MAVPSAYLTTTRNTAAIFEAIQRAGVPERFTYEFLKQLGFGSSGDRPTIPVLKAIGFLDDSSQPTALYRRFKDKSIAKSVMAQALRQGYSDLYAVDTEAHNKTTGQLAGMFARLSDKGEAVTAKMAVTFKALASMADFEADAQVEPPPAEASVTAEGAEPLVEAGSPDDQVATGSSVLTLRHDIHIHLPVSTEVAVFDAIFKSIRNNLL